MDSDWPEIKSHVESFADYYAVDFTGDNHRSHLVGSRLVQAVGHSHPAGHLGLGRNSAVHSRLEAHQGYCSHLESAGSPDIGLCRC